ncbi:hypothetical protein ACHAXN_007229 [Cyclotella atomus]
MGSKTKSSDSSAVADEIINTVRASDNGKSMELKSLRKAVLIATKHLSDKEGDIDKSTKKLFKAAVQSLENDGRVSLSADGIVKLSKTERKKPTDGKEEQSATKNFKDKKKKRKAGDNESDDDKKPKKSKKSKAKDEAAPGDSDNEEVADSNQDADNDGDENIEEPEEADAADKNKPCKGNPQGITRLFLGNLPFAITDTTLNDHLNSTITHIKWITDRETGKFYGSAFCEVKTSRDAAKAVSEINGTKVMGRPIKINYAPIKPGQEGDWPPKQKVITGGKVANTGQAGGQGIKAMSVKPEGCSKLFIGNLSYELDDDGITKFFMAVDAEIKAIRWLHHKDSGDFKGCGYVDFWSTEACEKAASLNGKNLLGRPIRIDWAE